MDKYDREIAEMCRDVESRDFSHVIADHWARTEGLMWGLFQYCTPDGKGDSAGHGCLTQVKLRIYEAWTPELTAKIRADDRIRDDPDDIESLDELEVYAEYQRLMDETIRQTPKPIGA